MSRYVPPRVSPEVRELLDRERVIPALPAHVRARSLARARAALIAGRVTAPAGFGATQRNGRGGIAKVAAACIASAAIGVAAYTIGNHRRPSAGEPPSAHTVHEVATPRSGPAPTISPSSTPATAIQTQHSSRASQNAEELRLLRKARAAVARQDFTAAMLHTAEHSRRFKDGRLAEEREALRVRALSGLGRTQAARQAADAFEARFRRSVLLPAVRQMPSSAP
jgi:hypothetical protein